MRKDSSTAVSQRSAAEDILDGAVEKSYLLLLGRTAATVTVNPCGPATRQRVYLRPQPSISRSKVPSICFYYGDRWLKSVCKRSVAK